MKVKIRWFEGIMKYISERDFLFGWDLVLVYLGDCCLFIWNYLK